MTAFGSAILLLWVRGGKARLGVALDAVHLAAGILYNAALQVASAARGNGLIDDVGHFEFAVSIVVQHLHRLCSNIRGQAGATLGAFR